MTEKKKQPVLKVPSEKDVELDEGVIRSRKSNDEGPRDLWESMGADNYSGKKKEAVYEFMEG